MKNIYQKMYLEENKINLSKNPRLKVMLKIVDDLNLENQNVLDIGCYDGSLLSLIKNQKNNFYGLEASDYGVAECLKKNIKVQNFFWDDKTPLPFENNFFDLVIAGEIIEHIFDTDYFLQEIERVLKNNGYLLISTPNIASLGRRLYLFFGKNPLIETSINSDNRGHIRYFTFRSLKDLLCRHQFEIIKRLPDVVNFSNSGRFRSRFLARVLPNLGQSIICLNQKILPDY